MNFVVVGASSGLGLGISEGLPAPADTVWLVSRSRPSSLDSRDGVERHWLELDVRQPRWTESLQHALADSPVDMLVYCAGIWESSASMTDVDPSEFYDICSVNVAGFVAAAVALAPNLTAARRAHIVAIGSTAGLENAAGSRAAYAASKFGVRGAVHGLREVFRSSGIATTCLSVGGLASDVRFGEGAGEALSRHSANRIPTADVVSVLKLLLQLSPATMIKEVDMPAQFDECV